MNLYTSIKAVRKSQLHSRAVYSRLCKKAGALACGLALAACGASKPPSVDAGPLGIEIAFPDGGERQYCGEASRQLVVNPRVVDVLVLFDRSGSMSLAFGDSTRFEVEQQLLQGLLNAYQSRIRFGFAPFPSKGGCADAGPAACCTDPPSVAVNYMSAADIGNAIADAAPVDGNTPTAQALMAARDYFLGLNDGVIERYVLLSTDGQPSCTASGELAKDVIRSGQRQQGPCSDALAAVKALADINVKVFVLGIGADLALGEQGAPSCLEELARAGGAATRASPSFYSAADPKTLNASLQAIFGAVTKPSCTLTFNMPAPDENNVLVLFDGVPVPRDQRREDGWGWLPQKAGLSLQVYGPACARLESLQVSEVKILYGCRPCTTPGSCQ
ncbi:MAG: vWA domain-containing protein [Deltaproteobacteria bacterium]|nr:vWA domain-containing protein [Deltaproteobacteria bacterium]